MEYINTAATYICTMDDNPIMNIEKEEIIRFNKNELDELIFYIYKICSVFNEIYDNC